MKIRHLPEIDLARTAVMPLAQARIALRQIKYGWPPYSYHPLRQLAPDILNIEAGQLGKCNRPPWPIVAHEIGKRCKSEAEAVANLAVGAALDEFATREALKGRRHDFYSLAVGLSAKVVYWSQAVLSYKERPAVIFIDPRLSRKLSARARQFVFSAMHARIRAADPDFENVQLGIFQFEKIATSNERVARLYTDDNIQLFSFEILDRMVRDTYALWIEILSEQDDRPRKTGTQGSLF